jgi:glycosyltransferase involved in cell wall biosynthesis
MHILQVVASSGWGGLERCVVELSNELAQDHEVTVLLPEDAVYADRFAGGVTLRSLPAGSRRNPLTVLRLARSIREIAPDVVHAHATKAVEMTWWASHLPGGLGGAPWVGTKHNTRRSRIFERVRHVTAVSRAAAGTLRQPQRAHIVYNGVRTREVEARPKDTVFTMISITRLDPYKRVDVLVRALSLLDFPARLLIAGDGSEAEAIVALAGELGLQDRVRLLGLRDDIPELLASAHVQVSASTREGFSLGIIEGLEYSSVVLTTPVGGAREILTPRFLVEADTASGDRAASAASRRAVAQAAVSPETFAAAMTRAYEEYDDYVEAFAELKERHGDRFTWARVARDYVDVYRSALASAPTAEG